MRFLGILALGLTLAGAAVAQAPDWRQTLGGLLSGNQDRDDALRQAYDRGYERGRNDEARLQSRRTRSNSYDDDSRERGGYNNR